MRIHTSSSMIASDGYEYRAPRAAAAAHRVEFDVVRLAHDLTGVGAGLAGAAEVGFPRELEIVA